MEEMKEDDLRRLAIEMIDQCAVKVGDAHMALAVKDWIRRASVEHTNKQPLRDAKTDRTA